MTEVAGPTRFFTCTEAGTRLGKSRSTINKWVRSGYLPSTNVRLNSLLPLYLIRQEDIDKFLQR